MKHKKVIAVHPSDELYGADRVFLEAIKTVPKGIELEVWLPTDIVYPNHQLSQLLIANGVVVRHVPLPIVRRSYMRGRALVPLAIRFVQTLWLLVKSRPDLVYVNTSAAAAVLPLAKLSGARTVLHLHEYLDGRTALFINPLLTFADRIIAVSHAITKPLKPTFRRRTEVIYNGFDLPDPEALPLFDPIVFTVASRWNAWKGHDVLLQAWAQLRRKDVQLNILGAPPVIGKTIDVEALVEMLPNRRTVRILGESDDVRSVIDASHVIVVPSTRPDPLPTIAIEALAAGRMVMASNCGGLPEIIDDDVGQLIDAGNVEHWVRAIENLKQEDIKCCAQQARGSFDANFDVLQFREKMAKALWLNV